MNHESLAISKRSFLKALGKGALATGLLAPRSSKGAMTYKPRPEALLTTDIREPSGRGPGLPGQPEGHEDHHWSF